MAAMFLDLPEGKVESDITTDSPIAVQVSASYHDGVGKVAIGLALQTHGGELGCDVALGGGLVQGRLPDASHFGGHEERQHALGEDEDKRGEMKHEERRFLSRAGGVLLCI